MATFAETFTAGQTKQFSRPGNFFRVKSLTALVADSLDVVFNREGKRLDVDLTDVNAGDYADIDGGFDSVEVTSSVAQTVTLQIARGKDGRVGSDRITGEVSVISGEKARVLSGVAFNAGSGQGIVGGQYSFLQLWNPAASGKRAVVDAVDAFINPAATSIVYVNRTVAAAGALVFNPYSHYLGGAVSALELRAGAAVALTGTESIMLHVVAGAPAPARFVEPYVVPPGQGLAIVCATLATPIFGNFQFYEEPNT